MKFRPEDELHIAYAGTALEHGRMSMLSLSNALNGQALLIERVNYLLYRDSVIVRIEVDDDFRSGSLIVPVHIDLNALRAVEDLLAGKAFTALANLLALLGFAGISVPSLYKIFRRLKGRRIEKTDDFPENLELDINAEVFIKIYNDAKVQEYLRKTIDPLHDDGIEEFQTRRSSQIVERVYKSDLLAADKEEIESLTKSEEIELDIEKAAWRRDLAWHFYDGHISFDAKIEDDDFWKRVQQGEAFSDGDRLRVHLDTTARRTHKGKLRVERVIPKVISVDHVRRRQRPLFDPEGD